MGAAAPSASAGVSQRASALDTTCASTPTADAGRTSNPPVRAAKTHRVVSASNSPSTNATDPPSMPPPEGATLLTLGAANRSTKTFTPTAGVPTRTATNLESEPASSEYWVAPREYWVSSQRLKNKTDSCGACEPPSVAGGDANAFKGACVASTAPPVVHVDPSWVPAATVRVPRTVAGVWHSNR